MIIHFFLRGVVVGFSIAAPVGPIGLLCIRRTAAYGRTCGFFSGMGVATADAFYGAVAAIGEDGSAKAYASTLFLTLTNPTTILSFVAVFAGLGLANASGDSISALSMVGGVFLGSATWWLILSSVVAVFRERLGARELAWVNRASGAILFGFGCAALWPQISALL